MESSSSSACVSFLGSIGFPLAFALSYVKWGGFWLAVGHGLCGWIYVFYFVLKYSALRHYLGF